MAKSPKFMQSRFDSRCCDCGASINKGETIYYLGRSRAQCQNCAPRVADTDQSHPIDTPKQSGGDNWADALAWQPAPPPGESINGNRQPLHHNARQNRIENRNAELARGDNNVVSITPSKPIPLSDLMPDSKPRYPDNEFNQNDRLEHQSNIDGAEKLEIESAGVVKNGEKQFEVDYREARQRGETTTPLPIDDTVAVIRDLLVAVVNAIDNADREQRAALDKIARDMMAHAGSMPRSRIWVAIADAVNA